ncbi:hypothetical protein DFQ45_10221 [Thiopseudomonas denitrificans]|uniref:Uncharacterized protein n=1 Tax=Thiopseudomonas denitrificans TaxID=1501432 RepID=A0A4R6U3J0_9GAMM|nr:hypothetical protein DFQ45_10221 [Thiopseudomonas denitrificans]
MKKQAQIRATGVLGLLFHAAENRRQQGSCPLHGILFADAQAFGHGLHATHLGKNVTDLHGRNSVADGLFEQLGRNVAAVCGDARQHLLVQPHVHLGRVAHQLGRAAQLGGQLLAGGQAAVQVQQLEQVDD